MKTAGVLEEMGSSFKGFYAGFMKRPNYYSDILKIYTGILKVNEYLVPNTCNLHETFCKVFFADFFYQG